MASLDFSVYSYLGVAVAGESTSTSMEGDMARALEAVLNPSTGEDNGDGRRGGPSTFS